MIDPNMVQVIIQGGCVGILLAFGVGAYLVVRRVMEMVNTLVSNHLTHLTAVLDKNTAATEQLVDIISGCPARESNTSRK